MLVREVMTKNVITTTPDEGVSQAIAKMRRYKIHQLPVMQGRALAGILTANKIITREVDPSAAKVSALMTPATSIKPDFTIEEAAELMINANLRGLPVFDRQLVGIISESDILKEVKLKASIDDVAKECIYVSEDDNVGRVKRIFSQENVSRVPVVKNAKCIGVVGTLELMDALEKSKGKFGSHRAGFKQHNVKESMNFSEIPVTMIMRSPTVINRSAEFAKALALLKQSEEVLVENGAPKIITPKDVLRLLSKPKEQAYYQLSGLDGIDDSDVAKMHQAIGETIKRLSKLAELQSMNVRVKKIGKQDERMKFEIHVQLPTNIGTFVVSKVIGWNLITAVQEAMNNLEREMKKKYEKIKNSDRATRAYLRGK